MDMREKKAWLKGAGILLLICLFAVWIPGSRTEAAGRMQKLKIGSTYTCRLSGKTFHTVKCTYTAQYENGVKLNIYIDGEKKLTLRDHAYSWDVALCRVSGNRNLIYVKDSSDNDWCAGLRIYEYKGGKLGKLGDLGRMTRNGKLLSNWARGGLAGVKKNQLTVKWLETTKSTGIIYVTVNYKVTGRKIQRIGTVYQTKSGRRKNRWTASRTILVSKRPGGGETAFTIKPGEKIRILGLAVKNKKQYLKVKNASGRTGWYQDPDSYTINGWFKEALFAG